MVSLTTNSLLIQHIALSMDMMDVAGEHQIGIEQTVYKRRLDKKTLRPLDEYKLQEKGNHLKNLTKQWNLRS
jgi:hypothetical protein